MQTAFVVVGAACFLAGMIAVILFVSRMVRRLVESTQEETALFVVRVLIAYLDDKTASISKDALSKLKFEKCPDCNKPMNKNYSKGRTWFTCGCGYSDKVNFR